MTVQRRLFFLLAVWLSVGTALAQTPTLPEQATPTAPTAEWLRNYYRAAKEVEAICDTRLRAKYQAALPGSFLAVLNNCDRLTVYELQGRSLSNHHYFRGFGLRAAVAINDRQQRQRILQAVVGDIVDPPRGASCFAPHYALRAVRGRQHVDILICYRCKQMCVQRESECVWCNIRDRSLPLLERVTKGVASLP